MKKLLAPKLPGWLEDELPFRRYRIDAGGIRWHVSESGPEDGPVVLMVHGNPTWAFLYRKIARRLHGSGLRCIVPDLPGLGFSQRIPFEAHTLDNYGDWLAALIDTLELRRAILVVQDWGGAIGLLGLGRSRAQSGGGVFLNTVVGPPKKGFKATFFHRFSQMPVVSDLVFRGMQFPQSTMSLVQGDPDSIDLVARGAYLYPLRFENVSPLALARMVPDSHDHPSIEGLDESQEYFEKLEGPLRYVWGENDPILGSVVGWLEKLRPDAISRRTDAGHFIQEEEPELIADAIRSVHHSVNV